MSDEIRAEEAHCDWEVRDKLEAIRHAPPVVDPETGKNVDPTVATLSYRWYEHGWVFIGAEVSGYEIDEDGNHPHCKLITIDFYDPIGGEPGQGKAPDWLVDLASKRMSKLPKPPIGGSCE